MPKTKPVEAGAKTPEECILKMGKNNNVIQWREAMYNLATEEFGEVGTYFYTNVAFRFPFPHEREYNPFYVEPVAEVLVGPVPPPNDELGEEDEDNEDVEEDIGEVHVPVPDIPAATLVKLVNKLREGAYEARRKREEAAHLALRKMWGKTWARMSPQSQSKVREEPGFEVACLNLDSIKLWTYIRKSHLTHMFGEDDEMSAANVHDQTMRYHNLKQGEREFISDLKIRFAHQVKSNEGVGIPEISDRLRAMDFIGKLDHKRYNGMLTIMRNNACQNVPGACPRTLQAAYRTASTWTRDGLLVPMGSDSHSTFLADTAFVAGKGKKLKSSKEIIDPKPVNREVKEKVKRVPGQACFVCGKFGHIARDCSLRKTPDTALLVSKLDDEHDSQEIGQYLGEIDDEVAYLTAEETILLSMDDVVFDNGSTVHLFKNNKLLTDIKESKHPITVNGVQANASGVRVSQQGKLGDIGMVYCSHIYSHPGLTNT